MNKRLKSIFLLLLAGFLACMAMPAFAAPVTVTNNMKRGAFPIAASGKASTVWIDPGDAPVVATAAALFCEDVERVAGLRPRLVNGGSPIPAGTLPVLFGTLGKSERIDQLASVGKIETEKVKGQWETFGIAVVKKPFPDVPQALVVYGSDARGTAFGIFELSRMMGVSPWYWWADVTPRKQPTVCVTAGESIFGPPSVKYRGIFINDEDWGLQPWAAKHLDTKVNDIGPRTYEKVFELMLRLKSNLLWPAMHPCTKAFWYYKENPELARKYDIVLGSSHCEQMLRNNVDEWVHNFPFEFGRLPGAYSWKNNSETIKMYWNSRVQESKNNDAIYTLGMRGIHDSGLPGYSSDRERADVLKGIIKEQRAMLAANIDRPVTEVPQIFCPYKEALKLYRLGLDLPEDVTLLWADDNFSYIRQLSDPSEQKRKGGGGVYYHFSYWGIPQDHLWLGCTPPALTVYELLKAYEMNCKEMWVFNVGDIKPIEYEMQYALDFAWDIRSFDLENADLYGKKWGSEIFGPEFAEAVYEIKRDYSHLASAGKPEHVNRVDYTPSEAEKRLADYATLVRKADSLQAFIPAALQDAYYQLIAYPVKASAAMNEKVLGSNLSFAYAGQGRKDEAMRNATLSREGYRKIVSLTERYNKEIAGGKWDGMMDYAPRGVTHFYEFKTARPEDVNPTVAPETKEHRIEVRADNYVKCHAAGQQFKTINGLGVSGAGLTVWPLHIKTYEAADIASAPYAEYRLRVRKGDNRITVKCLPTFPIYSGLKLRYAISLDGSEPQFVDIRTEAETKEWSPNVMQGYVTGTTHYQSEADGEVTARIYFPDAGMVLSSLLVAN